VYNSWLTSAAAAAAAAAVFKAIDILPEFITAHPSSSREQIGYRTQKPTANVETLTRADSVSE